MVKAMPMEDWLRGCIYHDGRQGYVTLPIDKVHQIANYIQRTRRSGMDGLIDLEVVRKDEPSNSEKPNNCEHITEDGVTCAKYPACDDCLDNPLNKVKGSERLVKGSEQTDCLDRYDRKTEPSSSEIPNSSTISKMEQVDKDINVRSKDEPITQMKTQNSNLTFKTLEYCDICDHKGCEECIANALDEYCVPSQHHKVEDKPQNCDTCKLKGFEGCEQPCLGCGCCGLYEAMTENDKLKEKVVEFIKSCARCKHRPIGAMMCEESCHYEPKDEPQTEDADCDKCIWSVCNYNKAFAFEDEPQTDCAWR